MLNTEMRNPNTMHIDKMDSLQIAEVMNRENMVSVMAVEKAMPQIAAAIDAAAEAIGNGGKMIYIGAGTSGRLGIQDAAECPPTFGVEDWVVQGIIAGGRDRVFKAGENAEDIYENGVNDVKDLLKAGDVLVGISAAGGAQYVIGALETAKKLGCTTVALTNNPNVAITKVADIAIVCDTGPEAITGSTRLKAGNTQKFVLNMLSTGAMVKTGKVYENLMINLKPSNVKLKGRVVRITAAILDCSEEEATALLEKNDWNIRKTVEGAK
ncbi:MAG: N-acetylmuramic acid 6-phosphate etherase [Oscillospiraceae bacterium]|nr:N-acetylmuramic acid 6-phosphate etherase [Oscillospiraceae bacterium]